MLVVVATVTAPVPAVRPRSKAPAMTGTKGDVARTSTSGDGRVRTKCHTASTKVRKGIGSDERTLKSGRRVAAKGHTTSEGRGVCACITQGNQASVQEVDRRNKRIRRAVQRNRPAIRRRDQVINRHIAGEGIRSSARERQVCDVGGRCNRDRACTCSQAQVEGTRNTGTKGDVARTSTSGDGRVRTKCHTASTKVRKGIGSDERTLKSGRRVAAKGHTTSEGRGVCACITQGNQASVQEVDRRKQTYSPRRSA